MKIFTKNFIEAINILKNNYTQATISSMISLHPQSLSQIMNEKRAPTVENISKLYTEFNINPIWILTGKGDMFIPYPPPAVSGGGTFPPQKKNNDEYCRQLLNEKDKEIGRLMQIIEMLTGNKEQPEGPQ